MIVPVLLLVVVCHPGCGRASLQEIGSAERMQQIPAEKHTAHGPQVDTGDLPGDPYSAYPGLGFGPMGPVVRSALPNDATLRSLSSASGDDAGRPKDSQLTALSGYDADVSAAHENSPKPEYHIITVEFPRVETPFVIGIWIFFASLAKIGKCLTKRRKRDSYNLSFFSRHIHTRAHTCARAQNGHIQVRCRRIWSI